MRFFVDFEATQFSNRIISIGCVAANGNTFSTLVKPGKKKITKFITDLTGITNEIHLMVGEILQNAIDSIVC